MGTGSSRLGSRPSRTRVNRTNRNRTRLASFLVCGGSSSHASVEMEEYPAEIAVNSSGHCNPVINMVQKHPEDPSLIFSTGTEFSSSLAGTGSSPGSSTGASEHSSIDNGLENVGTSSQEKCMTKTGLAAPCQLSADFAYGEYYRDRSNTAASTSSRDQHSSDTLSVNVSVEEDVANGIDNSANDVVSQIPESRSSSPQVLGNVPSDGVSDENHVDEITAIHNNDTDSDHQVSGLPLTFHSLTDEALPSGLGFLVSNREGSQGDGSVLHVDVVSISSNILSNANIATSNREARRTSRRLFWDAFSRRSSRRPSDSPTVVFSTDDTDDLGSYDRWLLDIGGDLFEDGIRGDSGYLGGRIHSRNERRRFPRSEIWERLRGGIDESDRRNNICPSGIHRDGTCSCESFLMSEESGTRASISRIVLLAEALFEVLDEIHRQPVSLSLSMVSFPAPESVVDSFPLKNHRKVESNEGDDVEQCYICLAEYEEGDKIRVLPCHHEYHMSCVDKWLKEIHGVCPLCRGDVCQGATGFSNNDIPSLS